MTNQNNSNSSGIELSEYIGPYEKWAFGDGANYVFPESFEAPLSGQPYYSALAEGLLLTTNLANKDDEAVSVMVPPMWQRGFTPSFTPFVYQSNQGEDLQTSLDKVYSQSGGTLSSQGSGNPSQVSFRTNFTIDQAIINDDFDPAHAPTHNGADQTLAQKNSNVSIIAIIDDALPFANKAFMDLAKQNSKVEFCWLQSAKPASVSDLPFGREYQSDEINQLIQAYGHDEDMLYEKAGATALDQMELGTQIRRHASHGAHIASLAAGTDRQNDKHPLSDEVRIIFVQLPNTVAWDTSGFGKDLHMLSAVHYIMHRAQLIAQSYAKPSQDELPLVINFSYGWSGGRHDGKDYLEAAIGELVEQRRNFAPTAMVMPSGNTFEDDLHGKFELGADQTEFDFAWQIPPDDRTSSYLEIWFEEGDDPADYEFTLAAPKSDGANVMGQKKLSKLFPKMNKQKMQSKKIKLNGETIGQLSLDLHRGTRWRLMVIFAPSQYVAPKYAQNQALTPIGDWQIHLKRKKTSTPAKKFNIWVQRDNDPVELKTGGKPSKLVDLSQPLPNKNPLADAEYKDDFICPFGCLTGLCNHVTTTVVAGFNGKNLKASEYSSASSLQKTSSGALEPNYKSVDCSAMSDRSQFLDGNIGSGIKSASTSWYIGTSAAAPQVARLLAKEFATLPLSDIEAEASNNYVHLLENYGQIPPGGAPLNATPPLSDEVLTSRARFGKLQIL